MGWAKLDPDLDVMSGLLGLFGTILDTQSDNQSVTF